ncbi:hypothetical protein GH714_000812 [Hevea brasiliensis]|uniref:Uncharacterized protein n=1 Tax=Hevea brasiliensis TaxID=3981 RepID=A0A6A6L873_HEVBR|nr:hypothetical protein GH714_000812 [Hevea brasiliensis]
MRESQLKRLWTEDQIPENLQFVDLSHSMNLIRIPELSKFPKLKSNGTLFRWMDKACIPGSQVPPRMSSRDFIDIGCECCFATESGQTLHFESSWYDTSFADGSKMHNVLIWYSAYDLDTKCRLSEASFQFYAKEEGNVRNSKAIVKCGVHLFDDDVDSLLSPSKLDKIQPTSWVLKMAYKQRFYTESRLYFPHFTDDDECEKDELPLQNLEEIDQELKCLDLNLSIFVLFTSMICPATSRHNEAEAHPRTHVVFILMILSVCLELLSFNSSLSLHGMRVTDLN